MSNIKFTNGIEKTVLHHHKLLGSLIQLLVDKGIITKKERMKLANDSI